MIGFYIAFGAAAILVVDWLVTRHKRRRFKQITEAEFERFVAAYTGKLNPDQVREVREMLRRQR